MFISRVRSDITMAQNELKTEADYTQAVFEQLKGGVVALELYRGYKLGIFEQLAKYDEPKTSQEIATDLDMKERYVREWLNCMVTSRFLRLHNNGDSLKYSVDKQAAEALCGVNASGPVWCGFISSVAFGRVQDQINQCFGKKGPLGVAPEEYNLEWKADAARKDYTWDKLEKYIAEIPGLREKLESGIFVLEPGCGGGVQSCIMAEQFPKCTVIGFDLSTAALEKATELAKSLGLKNVQFQQGDACAMPNDWTNKFGYAYCIDTIHDIWKPSLVLSEICRVLQPEGTFSMIDINISSSVVKNTEHPLAAMCYGISLNYCMTTALVHPGADGVGTAWGKESMVQTLKDAGFKQAELKTEYHLDVHVVGTK